MSKKKEEQLIVGVPIPQQFSSYITIYTIIEGTPKTVVLRKLIEEWVEAQLENRLIDRLLCKLQNKWKIEKSLNPSLTINKFKYDTGEWLEKKGIEQSLVEVVLNKLKDGKN